MFIYFLVPLLFSASSMSENYIMSFTNRPYASSEENKKASEIVDSVKQNVDQCYSDLNRTLIDYCIELDVTRRKKLAISLMICEQIRDGRQNKLPSYTSDESFIANLDENGFTIYTLLFINIDTICFQCARENMSASNMQKIMGMFQAVSTSTTFLNNIQKKFANMSKNILLKSDEFQALLAEQTKLIQSIEKIVVRLLDAMQFVNGIIKSYQLVGTNIKMYIYLFGLSLLLSIKLPNVFFPNLFLIGAFLYIEGHVPKKSFNYPTQFCFRFSFILLSLIVFIISIAGKVKSYMKKKEKKRRNKKSCNLQVSESLLFEKQN